MENVFQLTHFKNQSIVGLPPSALKSQLITIDIAPKILLGDLEEKHNSQIDPI
jgi:hypothetical protein